MRSYDFIKLTIVISIAVFSFVSCKRAIDSNRVVDFFRNPDYDKYKIENIALLPMENDDTTSTGTFYSTNYFFNRLLEIPSISIVDIDKIVSTDFISISEQMKVLETNSKLDLDQFLNSDLGNWLNRNNCDVIILGDITNFKMYYYTWYSAAYSYMIAKVTVCNFKYYQVSLKDGAILWKANVDGEATYLEQLSGSDDAYPPLDEAISNGIELLLEKLKMESILYKK
jgi:hypothetical protein